MTKIIRLTENDLMRIVKRVINEQNEDGQTKDPGNPSDLNMVMPVVKSLGFKVYPYNGKTNELRIEKGGDVDSDGITILFSSPHSPLFKQGDYVVRLIINKKGKQILLKDYFMNKVNQKEIVNLITKYNPQIFVQR